MNKYQRAILENQDVKVFYTCSSIKNSAVLAAGFDYDNDTYALTQEEDIFSTTYEFVVKANPNIESCEYYCNGAWCAVEKKAGNFVVMLDFEKRVEKVKFTFADNLADDYIFMVNYTEADKDLYYKKQADNRRNTYIAAAQIKHSTGADLVNIYFQPCSSDYIRTEIALYRDGLMLAKYKVDEESFFKSIGGLAYGTYSVIVKQFDRNDNLLLETEHIEFTLKSPKAPVMGRINRI
jgi:hypothetical protein